MAGASALWIQPMTRIAGGKLRAGPPTTPANPEFRTSGQAGPNNLIELSPPTLLEQYEVYGGSIAWGIQYADAGNDGKTTSARLTLLLNDRPVWSSVDDEAQAGAVASGTFSLDLLNPIPLGARDRLGIALAFPLLVEVGINAGTITAMLGAQSLGGVRLADNNWPAVESTIQYRVLDLPGARRV